MKKYKLFSTIMNDFPFLFSSENNFKMYLSSVNDAIKYLLSEKIKCLKLNLNKVLMKCNECSNFLTKTSVVTPH